VVRSAVVKRVLGEDWLLPALDARNRDWFTAGRLLLPACARCAAVQFPPEDACRRCGAFEFATRESAGRGRVESVAIVHHAVHPRLRPHVPYAVVLVALDDAPGVRLVGNVTNRKPDAIAIGAPVRVVFEEFPDPDTGETLRIPQWEVIPG
jgi:uncharacterized OB-fold protein